MPLRPALIAALFFLMVSPAHPARAPHPGLCFVCDGEEDDDVILAVRQKGERPGV